MLRRALAWLPLALVAVGLTLAMMLPAAADTAPVTPPDGNGGAQAASLGTALHGSFGGTGGPEPRSPIVYPLQRLPLIFSHAKHLARGTPCAACHAGGTTSQSAVDNLLPTETECRACHAIDRAKPELVIAGAPPTRCAACHPNYRADQPVARTYLAPPPLKFAHAAHAQAPCATCHGDLAKVDLATIDQLPTMEQCLTCHTDGNTEAQCTRCHLAELGGLMQTRFDTGDLVPARNDFGDAHGPGFATDHRQAARQVGAACTACHDRSECIECHQGTVKPMDFHQGDYLLTHPIEARRGRPDCSACHRYETFCVSCHERSGIGTRFGDFNSVDPGRAFHPPNWANASTGIGGNLHATEARKNISSCASCHRDEDCMKCHTAEPGKGNISPHPAGWRGSAKCKAMDRGDRRMCLRCHIEANQVGCDWGAGSTSMLRAR
jgi:hypothetical protein